MMPCSMAVLPWFVVDEVLTEVVEASRQMRISGSIQRVCYVGSVPGPDIRVSFLTVNQFREVRIVSGDYATSIVDISAKHQ